MWVKEMISLDNPIRLFYHFLRAVIASLVYWFPSKDMTIVGVTWTNWKTTTCNIIAKWLRESWEKVFMFSTVNIIIWDEEFVNNTKMTTPDVFMLQRLLKKAKDTWCTIAIIETASHWIKMHRTWWIDYDVAVLTNISQDHLDLHKTMEDYVKTKLKIFKELITYKRKEWVKKTAIINVNTEYASLFMDQTYDSMYWFWIWKGSSLVASNIIHKWNKTYFDVTMPWWTLKVETNLKWDFNIDNILAAIWVFIAFWIPQEIIPKIIASIDWVPWRMENIPNDLWADIIVDYAHTPDALEKVLLTLKDYSYNKIITVFWATWDRDRTKRAIMWEIVSKYSDVVILTQDDDYTENTSQIIKDILPWINREEWENFFIIPTRLEAIEAWIASIEEWDVLIVCWKWDEQVLVTNDWPIEWHDKSVIKEILKQIEDNKIIK